MTVSIHIHFLNFGETGEERNIYSVELYNLVSHSLIVWNIQYASLWLSIYRRLEQPLRDKSLILLFPLFRVCLCLQTLRPETKWTRKLWWMFFFLTEPIALGHPLWWTFCKARINSCGLPLSGVFWTWFTQNVKPHLVELSDYKMLEWSYKWKAW